MILAQYYSNYYDVTATLYFSGGSVSSSREVKMDSSNYKNGQFDFDFDGLTVDQANSIYAISASCSENGSKIFLKGSQSVVVDYILPSRVSAPTSVSLSAATTTGATNTLSWSGAAAGTANGIAGYFVQYSDSSDGSTWNGWGEYGSYSPAAVVGEIRTKNIPFETSVCKTTVYSYISKGVFLHLTNKDLPRRGKKKNQYRQVRAARPPRGESIENRPAEINERRTFGHWEMDTVVGKKGGGKRVSLMLTERKTLFEIIIPIRDKSDESVVAALNRLEKRFGKLFPLVFRSITVDNGSEFANCRGMEKSKYRKGDRTKMYYCHPYSSYERGSNENQNGMFRRKVPKGTDLSRLPLSVFQDVEDWMNNYPRGIHGFRSARELFEECLQEIASK